MSSSLLQPQHGSVLTHIARCLTAPSLSSMERQIRHLLAEQRSAAEAQAEAVASAQADATKRCLREILRLVDAIDSLEAQTREKTKEKAGAPAKRLRDIEDSVRAISSLADNVLSSLGAQRIEPRRLDAFDSTIHNAIRVTEDPGLPSNVVSETLQMGLRYRDTIIRPAQVVINDVC